MIKIGQGEVFKVLEKSEVPMSRDQIAKKIDELPVNVSKIINLLLKHKDIKCVEMDRYQSAKLLNWINPIRRTRFYYVEIKLSEMKKWLV